MLKPELQQLRRLYLLKAVGLGYDLLNDPFLNLDHPPVSELSGGLQKDVVHKHFHEVFGLQRFLQLQMALYLLETESDELSLDIWLVPKIPKQGLDHSFAVLSKLLFRLCLQKPGTRLRDFPSLLLQFVDFFAVETLVFLHNSELPVNLCL